MGGPNKRALLELELLPLISVWRHLLRVLEREFARNK